MTYPLYLWFVERFRGYRSVAALATLLVLLLGVAIPVAGFLTLVASEAVQVSQSAEAWFQDQDDLMGRAQGWLLRIPFAEQLELDRERIVARFQEEARTTGQALGGILARATRGTLSFFLQAFILLYAYFFFLTKGPHVLDRTLGYLPLAPAEKDQLLERFLSVARATLKGSLLIGVIQGAVAGVAFWVAGVPGPAFWGTVMVVLSIIPAIGAGLVWIPAVVYLALVGQPVAAGGLLAWCAVVVSSIDNFLRPRLVGRDARMSDLLILLSTLGGIGLFGVVGFIVGPIVAALFVTAWHIYGEAFQDWLPAASPAPSTAGPSTTGPTPTGRSTTDASPGDRSDES